MTKLTTERLEEMRDHYLGMVNKDVGNALTMLLAYEQAAKNPVAWVATDSEGFPEYNSHNEFSADCGAGTPLYAAPVLPKQPEPENKIAQIKRQKALAWLKRVAYENPCMKEVKTCIEVLSAPAQPAMPVQEIVGWIFEDELPKNYPYDAMFVHSKVDVVRMFPVFAPSSAQPVIPEHCQMTPDEMLCDFYEVSNWPDLVRELVKHVEQLQESAKRNVKPWEDTFPETLLPAYVDRITRANDACRAEMLKNGKSASTELPNHSELSTDSPVIPDGWKLVPIEPTAAMFHAFNDDDYGRKSMRERYIQMIEAAPAREIE